MTARSHWITVGQAAEADIFSIFDYLAAEAGLGVADKFLDALEGACKYLARFPKIGVELSECSLDIQKLRRWPIPEFANYLIYYRLDSGNVDIVRILHGAQDVRSLLKDS